MNCEVCGERVPINEFLAFRGKHENCDNRRFESQGYTPGRIVSRRIRTLHTNGLVRRKKVPE
jgi:hypothetical protein